MTDCVTEPLTNVTLISFRFFRSFSFVWITSASVSRRRVAYSFWRNSVSYFFLLVNWDGLMWLIYRNSPTDPKTRQLTQRKYMSSMVIIESGFHCLPSSLMGFDCDLRESTVSLARRLECMLFVEDYFSNAVFFNVCFFFYILWNNVAQSAKCQISNTVKYKHTQMSTNQNAYNRHKHTHTQTHPLIMEGTRAGLVSPSNILDLLDPENHWGTDGHHEKAQYLLISPMWSRCVWGALQSFVHVDF